MTDQERVEAGWYPHPSMPGTLGYWDGAKWTDHVAPTAPPTAAPKSSDWSVGVIAAGILVAAVVIWFVYSVSATNDDAECAIENADRAMDGQPLIDCD